jgi:hypothetical protein
MNSIGVANFVVDKNKFLNKTISLIVICENENNNLLNTVLISNSHDINDIVSFLNEYFYKDNISDEVFRTKVNDFINKSKSNEPNPNNPTYVIYS